MNGPKQKNEIHKNVKHIRDINNNLMNQKACGAPTGMSENGNQKVRSKTKTNDTFILGLKQRLKTLNATCSLLLVVDRSRFSGRKRCEFEVRSVKRSIKISLISHSPPSHEEASDPKVCLLLIILSKGPFTNYVTRDKGEETQ